MIRNVKPAVAYFQRLTTKRGKSQGVSLVSTYRLINHVIVNKI